MTAGSKSRHFDRVLSVPVPTSNHTTTTPILPQLCQSTGCSSYPSRRWLDRWRSSNAQASLRHSSGERPYPRERHHVRPPKGHHSIPRRRRGRRHRPGRRAHRHHPARAHPRRPVPPKCFERCRYLHHPLRLLPAGATVCRAGFAPAEGRCLSTAHRKRTGNLSTSTGAPRCAALSQEKIPTGSNLARLPQLAAKTRITR